MHILKKAAISTVALGGVLTTAPSAAAAAPEEIVIQGTCGQQFSPEVPGGAAGWTITCGGGTVRVQGWVRDTRADGRAAEVYGSWGDGIAFPRVRASGFGNQVEFNNAHSGRVVNLYLRVI
jgi:hypothetical protein